MNKFFKGFVFAYRGIVSAVRSERNMKVHVVLAIFTVCAGLYVRLTAIDWCLIVLCIGLVLVAELINTAIEKIIDHIEPSWQRQAGNIKDIAAGAVLCAAVVAAVVGLLIFTKYVAHT